MPAKTERQRKAAGVALAVQKGEAVAQTEGVKRLAKIPKAKLKHYARKVKKT